MNDLIDDQKIDNAAKYVCRKMNMLNEFEDMKSELVLAVLEGKISQDIQSLIKYAWKYYLIEESKHRVYLNFDLIDSPVYVNDFLLKNENRNKCYNICYVEKVYELRAEMKTFKEIGEELSISRCWANLQVLNTIHLPFVSTYLKNKSFEASRVLNGRRSLNGRRIKPLRGNQLPQSKLTDKKVIKLRRFFKEGMSCPEIAKKFDISRKTAHAVAVHRTWKHVS